MKIVLYATISKEKWKEEYYASGIKGVECISGLYAQTRDQKHVKDAILTQAVPFWIGINREEVIIQFEKDPKEIMVDFGDSPDAYDKGIPPEEDDTYEHLDPQEVVNGTTILYCSWVKEIRPEEIIQVVISIVAADGEGDPGDWLIDRLDEEAWINKQPRIR